MTSWKKYGVSTSLPTKSRPVTASGRQSWPLWDELRQETSGHRRMRLPADAYGLPVTPDFDAMKRQAEERRRDGVGDVFADDVGYPEGTDRNRDYGGYRTALGSAACRMLPEAYDARLYQYEFK